MVTLVIVCRINWNEVRMRCNGLSFSRQNRAGKKVVDKHIKNLEPTRLTAVLLSWKLEESN